MRSSRAVLAATVLAGSTTLAVQLSTGVASAAPISLPVTSVGGVVVDGAHQRLFLSDPATGEIIATDYSGAVLDREPGLPGVRGLALSRDSNILYAAVDGAGAIATFATETLTEITRYPLGADVFPGKVAVTGDRIWFGYDRGTTEATGNFGSLDADGTVRLHERSSGEQLYPGAPNLFADDTTLLVAPDGVGYGMDDHIRTFDVSGAVEKPLTMEYGNRLDVRDADFTADGTRVFRVGWLGFCRVDLNDATTSTRLWDRSTPDQIDIAADGSIALGSGNGVYVRSPDGETEQWSASLAATPVPDGLHWQPGTERLLAVTESRSGFDVSYALESVVEPPPAPPSPTPSTVTIPAGAEITLSAPATVVNGRKATFSGTTTGLPIGHTLTVTRADENRPGLEPETIGRPALNSDGSFTFTDLPPGLSTYLYRVSYAGNMEQTAKVKVTQFTPALSLDKHGSVQKYEATVTVTATLGKTYANRAVEIWVDDVTSFYLLKRATVNSAGKVSASYKIQKNVTFTAKFTGDQEYAARSVTSRVYAKVSVVNGVKGHYKTKKIGKTKYYHFRKTADPYFNVTMTRHPGRHQYSVIQRYRSGKWTAFADDYFPLDRYGKSTVRFAGTYPAGSKWRFRTAYIYSGSGDEANYTTYGAWNYFTYTK
ncbi:hypothetical protein [Actinoplanes derwentensis]|uniref:Uncharacterized protein n=1 Tax=Actinoplanes derwentensis TaxID=113562 RepID=A0A1H2CNC2_9ACTN|nr:hypothetical protein [Actinoplanes derwentensis]GID86211.1 hypothetical protein Ade03nite_51350 [Actinoplanes derwentensis]SDT71804.1 hypothetical protein SAMN04489716_6257 [Actinoplanes derwentensis]